MADCVEINQQRIRSKITIENLSWGVPGSAAAIDGYIRAFSISQTRGDPIAKLSCTLETFVTSNYSQATTIDDEDLGACIRVWAGIDAGSNTLPQLFTGYIRDLKIIPSFTDARLVILEITAEDVFSKMKDHKFSRRFKMKDGAFAVITGGVRRQGGRMNQLKRDVRSGAFHENKVGGGDDQFGENSPLITTPTPEGRKPWGESKPGTDDVSSVYHFEPQNLVMKPGDRAIVTLYDQKGVQRKIGAGDGNDINIEAYKSNMICFISPNFTAGASSGSVTKGGFVSCDLSTGDTSPGGVRVITSSDTQFASFAGSLLITMKDWYPFQILYIDPETKGMSKIDVGVIYPHSHEDLAMGGPAKATFGTFQV